MGTSFFWFYDIVLLAIIAGVTFRSLKKGGVAVIISTAAVIIAFIAAFIISNTVSDAVYRNYIEEPLLDYIDETIDETVGDNVISDLQKIDMSKAVIGGQFLGNMEFTPDSAGEITLDLSDIDLTETGMQEVDLTIFGIDDNFDYSLVKVGNVEISENELKDRSIESIVLARVLTSNIKSGELFTAFEDIGTKISEAIPVVFGDYSEKIADGNNDIIYDLVLSVTDMSYDNHGKAVLANIVDPIVIVPMKIVIFLLVFTIVSIALEALANASKIINRIPVISSANEALGGILGLLKSAVIILVICIGVQFLVSVTNDSLVFINTSTIQETVFFKHIYNLDLINLLKAYV